jgi:hypothetical protein
MTSRDLMPFGKHKGLPLEQVPRSYAKWLCDQDGFAEKNPALYAYFTQGEAAVAAPKELATNSQEDAIFKTFPPAFKQWWDKQYGNRLRGSDHYIPHLLVASAAWAGCAKWMNDEAERHMADDPDDPLISDLTGDF